MLLFAALTEELMAPGKYPGCTGTRNLEDNISDLRAQVAANHKVSIIIEWDTYIAHFTNVPMRFTNGGGLFRAAYYLAHLQPSSLQS
jgi:hypothetical protein